MKIDTTFHLSINWIVLVGILINKLHLFMHFFVHGLDMHYSLPRPLYRRTSSQLAVLLREAWVIPRPLLGWACLALLCLYFFKKLIDVTSPRLENFLVLGFSAFL